MFNVQKKQIDDNLHLIIEIRAHLLSFQDSAFLFLSVDGCSCAQVHQFASFLSGYSRTRHSLPSHSLLVFLLNVVDMLDIDDSKEDVYSIASVSFISDSHVVAVGAVSKR